MELSSGVLVASRHIHLHPKDGEVLKLADGDKIRVRVMSQRPMTFEDVLIRISPNYQKEMHLDLDEANAVLIGSGDNGLILEEDG